MFVMVNEYQALNLFICWMQGAAIQEFTVNELWEFYEIAMSWPSAEKERLVGAVSQKLSRVRLVSDCSQEIQFVDSF